MANTVINVQISFPSSVRNPAAITGANPKRITLLGVAQLIYGMIHGSTANLGGSGSYIQTQSSLVAASATATPASVINADTLTIAGTALTATQRRATGTITCATAIAGNTVTINGAVFTGAAGAVTPGAQTFSIDTGNTACATSIAAQINASVDPRVAGVVGARSSAAVVTLYAINQGTTGNALTLASSGATLAVSGALLTGGAAITNNTFDFAGSNITTGQAIAAAILASTTTAIQSVTATANATTGVVTVTAKVAGVAGNAVTFVSSNGVRLAVTGSGFLASGSAGAPTRYSFG